MPDSVVSLTSLSLQQMLATAFLVGSTAETAVHCMHTPWTVRVLCQRLGCQTVQDENRIESLAKELHAKGILSLRIFATDNDDERMDVYWLPFPNASDSASKYSSTLESSSHPTSSTCATHAPAIPSSGLKSKDISHPLPPAKRARLSFIGSKVHHSASENNATQAASSSATACSATKSAATFTSPFRNKGNDALSSNLRLKFKNHPAAQPLHDKIKALRSQRERIDESLRKFKLVQNIKSQHSASQVNELIEKWIAVCHECAEKLHAIAPEGTRLGDIISHLGVNCDWLAYDKESDCFN